jgi:hypothetical protein
MALNTEPGCRKAVHDAPGISLAASGEESESNGVTLSARCRAQQPDQPKSHCIILRPRGHAQTFVALARGRKQRRQHRVQSTPSSVPSKQPVGSAQSVPPALECTFCLTYGNCMADSEMALEDFMELPPRDCREAGPSVRTKKELRKTELRRMRISTASGRPWRRA